MSSPFELPTKLGGLIGITMSSVPRSRLPALVGLAALLGAAITLVAMAGGARQPSLLAMGPSPPPPKVTVFGTSHAMHLARKLHARLRWDGLFVENHGEEAATLFDWNRTDDDPCGDAIAHPSILQALRDALALPERPRLAILVAGATDSRPCLWARFGSTYGGALHRFVQLLRRSGIPTLLVSPPAFLHGRQTFPGVFGSWTADCDSPTELHGRDGQDAFDEERIVSDVIPAMRQAAAAAQAHGGAPVAFFDLHAAMLDAGLESSRYANCAHLVSDAYYPGLERAVRTLLGFVDAAEPGPRTPGTSSPARGPFIPVRPAVASAPASGGGPWNPVAALRETPEGAPFAGSR